MITARKSKLFERVFTLYNLNLIARRFEGLRVAGLNYLKERGNSVPLVLYANHSSWWDGLVAFAVGRECRLQQYAMMEERGLRMYPFHRKLGAFSVVRESAREAMRSIEYAAELLNETNRVLWVFPQGETQPNDARPLKMFTGAARIVERLNTVDVAAVAVRYEFLDDFRPEIFVRVGSPERITPTESFNVKSFTRAMEKSLTDALDGVRDDILRANFVDYEEIIAPRRRSKETPKENRIKQAEK